MDNMNMCIVCRKCIDSSSAGRKLGLKGLLTLCESSMTRHDELHEQMRTDGEYYVHDKCYKSYTKPTNISSAQSSSSAMGEKDSPVSKLRSQVRYDYPTHCLICAEELNFDAVWRNRDRLTHISSVEIVSREKRSLIQDSLMAVCDKREDAHAMNVKARIEFAGDIRAVEAKYHRTCMQTFMSHKNIDHISSTPRDNARNLNSLNDKAFANMCDWFADPEQQDKQFTVVDLRAQLASHLPPDVPAYSTSHIKRRLLNHFGNDVTVAELDGKTNVVTLKNRSATILHKTYVDTVDNNEEANISMSRSVGSVIRQTLQELEQSTDVYPTPSDVSIDSLEESVPRPLTELVKAMFSESRSTTGKQKKQLLQTSLCHVIMNAAGKRSYISPLMLSVGLFIHQSTRSRVLLDVLSSLSLSVSYDQVMDFERSAVVNNSISDLPPGLVNTPDGGGFCQWVADNFDYNEDTLTGHDTTHVMGIITCQTPRSADQRVQAIPRKTVTVEEILRAGQFGDIIMPYKSKSTTQMADVQIKPICPVTLTVSNNMYEHMDTLWLYSSRLFSTPPNWQGFMSEVVKGNCQCSAVVYNPMIPLNPQTNEAVYSTMLFVREQSKKAGMCCATLTFDQPLYVSRFEGSCSMYLAQTPSMW